ncbi:cation:proton antiporter domain-containing protein [Prauserella flavalba]|uniref:Sodium:proton antiporter n=1 Tax=Prauserella flavalba TaxID=1477506 RepID=A0A318LND3_9PSEU|nr:cation:proton antiporter [Prauserella flavalba]PXY36112.1 sodium:proton antiporter [Prauserella flavalba]
MSGSAAATGAIVAGAVFAWGLVGGRLQRAELTAPLVFVVLGGLLGSAVGVFDIEVHEFRLLIELTLAWLLFSDASAIRLAQLRREAGWYARLLGVGLPLTVVGGWLVAEWLLPGAGGWLAVLVGAALAPTDAALGLPVLTDPAVPRRIRGALNVESGLNDGIVTPVVMVAIAGVAGTGGGGVGAALADLVLGGAVGAGAGAVGGLLIRRARRLDWVPEGFAGPAVLALVVAAFAGAVAAGGNGFIAAFAAGLAFGGTAGSEQVRDVRFVEQTGGLAAVLVWLLAGAVAFPIVAAGLGWQVVVYAVLSLTVLRMVPVALALLGTRLDRVTVLFVGWFGPRGLPSIIFALLAVDALGDVADPAVVAIALTVLSSVVAHGLSARPLASRYGAAVTRAP